MYIPWGALYYSHVINTWVAEGGTPVMTIEKHGVGYGTINIIYYTVTHPAETHIEVVHHDAEYHIVTYDVWVENKHAWTEDVVTPQYSYETEQVWVVDEGARTETVVTANWCTGCGATE